METTKRETYKEMRKRHQQEFNEFPIHFAFGNEQFAEAMADWGFTPEDTDKIVSIGAGGFIRKTDVQAFLDLNRRHNDERTALLEDEENLYQMFLYEMWNHEYGYTHEPEDTLMACGFTWGQIKRSKKKLAAWQRAEKRCFAGDVFGEVHDPEPATV